MKLFDFSIEYILIISICSQAVPFTGLRPITIAYIHGYARVGYAQNINMRRFKTIRPTHLIILGQAKQITC